MKKLEKDAQSVLMNSHMINSGVNFNAFNIMNESLEIYRCKLSFSLSEEPARLGRVKIFNRLRPFTLTLLRKKDVKLKSKIGIPFKVFVSYEDSSFSDKK